MANKGSKFPAEVYSPDELDRFFATFSKRSVRGRRNRCIFLLALRAQLRSFEVVSLRVSDVDTKTCTILIRHGKGNKRRVVGIDKSMARELDDWISSRELKLNDLLFTSSRGNPLDTSYLRKIAKAHGIRAKIFKRMHVHGYRHSGACIMANQGVDIRVISKQLGHSNVATTSRYIDHLNISDVVSAVSAIQW